MTLNWTALDRIARHAGESFYLYWPEAYRQNHSALLKAFRQIYPNTRLAHSYKTNYLPSVCRLADELGSYAEVVSELEYSMALRFGVNPRRIIFNGPVKPKADLVRALDDGSLVNIDNAREARMITEYARGNAGRQISVGIRLNFDIGTNLASRFGFDVDSDELMTVLRDMRGTPNCHVRGLHCHFSGARQATSFERRAAQMIDLAAKLFPDSTPEYLDIGGGLCGVMGEDMRSQLTYDAPTFRDYAEAAAGPFARRYESCCEVPLLIVEAGMALLSNVHEFVCRIQALKTIRGRRFAFCAGSIYNTQPLSRSIVLPITVVHARENHSEVTRMPITAIVGHTCMEIDVMHPGYEGAMGEDDFVVFPHTGAYTTVLTPPFIHPGPAIVEPTDNRGGYRLLRRRQTSDDVLAPYFIGDTPASQTEAPLAI
ncbi:MAG: alanine racemase [Thermodesulfobacteriota bacterium]|nr:alanine racemase [Thermodesulfobacteriota bacterium]